MEQQSTTKSSKAPQRNKHQTRETPPTPPRLESSRSSPNPSTERPVISPRVPPAGPGHTRPPASRSPPYLPARGRASDRSRYMQRHSDPSSNRLRACGSERHGECGQKHRTDLYHHVSLRSDSRSRTSRRDHFYRTSMVSKGPELLRASKIDQHAGEGM